jgi:hypothetical protein
MPTLEKPDQTTLGALVAETTATLAQIVIEDDELICTGWFSAGSVTHSVPRQEDSHHRAKKPKRRREVEPEPATPEPEEKKAKRFVQRKYDFSAHAPPHLRTAKIDVVKKAFRRAVKMDELWTSSTGKPKSSVTRADLNAFLEWYTSNPKDE